MTQTFTSDALKQARSINSKRLAALVCFAAVMVLVRRVAFPVPLATFAIFGIWIGVSALYQLNMKRLASNTPAETMQATMLAVDVTLITALHAIVGGGWWMGATVYIVVANAAFASLPERLGWFVSGYAALAFVWMIVAQAAGIGEYREFLGIQPITGHYEFAIVAALFGMMVMLTGVYLQDHFVRQKRRSEEKLRNSEEQLRHSQKMEAIGGLAGGIAHDFNNILTAIRTYNNFLLEDLAEDNPSRREAAGIAKAVDHAAALTRQLLAFSRRQFMQPRMLNLNDSVRGLEQMLTRLLGSSIQFTTSLDASLGMTNADPGQIEQVIVNLAVNARDAMPGGGKLRIETGNASLDSAYMQQHAASDPGDYVMIAVRDTGIGMDRATQARIFEPFFTTKESGKGTGLGLAMVYGIVRQSGGHVWVYSEPGQGTTFKVYLPRAQTTAEAIVPESASVEILAGSETILLVEDEESVREVSGRLLRRAGYTVMEAEDGRRALEIVSEHTASIDVLVTDMVMPEIGGRELARRVRAMRPDMPLVFMSGYTDDEELRRSYLEKGSVFLEKPFTPELLLSKTREVLATRKSA
jgi:signal transduction histidine kinase